MTGLPICDPALPTPCPERFRVSASEWIDATNFGELPENLSPPAGIRLRWNWPLVRPTGEPALPKRFVVRRSGPISPERLVKPLPTVGHVPRMFAPPQLWRPFARSSNCHFVFHPDPCVGAQAIRIVMKPNAPIVSVALIDIDGVTRLTGELGPGDTFYYELADISQLIFSGVPSLMLVEGLSLAAADAQAADIGFANIATLDARAWLDASLAEVSERMASDQRPPFVSISESDWLEFRQHGRELVGALDASNPPPQTSLNHVELAIALRWEVAALAAWGFLDGEHVSAPTVDQINAGLMLTPGASGIYAYQIIADFGDSYDAAVSDIAFTVARPMPALSAAVVTSLSRPRTRSELVNHFNSTPQGELPPVLARPEEQFFNRSSWQISVHAPYSDWVVTSPRASDSQIVTDRFEHAGEFVTDGLRRPVRFQGMERVEQRDHDFRVPFYDSDVWLDLAVGDHWDRRLKLPPTPQIEPEIAYAGACIGIAGGSCDAASRKAVVSLDFAASPNWVADPLARHANATIDLLLKNPALDRAVQDVMLFPASPAGRGRWTAEIETAADFERDHLAAFVGGMLSLDGFQALIIGFEQVQSNRYRCEFEKPAICAGAELYACGPDGVHARLEEADGSDRVWDLVGTIPLLLDGTPDGSTGTIRLPELETSMLLHCSTRLRFYFEGRAIVGPRSTSALIPYLHPAPKAPDFCFGLRTLAIDYYGRAIVRAETLNCERFDPSLDVSIAAAEGIVDTPERFIANASTGLFGVQSPLGNRVAFDAFKLLGNRPEGSVDTLGIRHVRPSDGRESDPELRPFENRRTC